MKILFKQYFVLIILGALSACAGNSDRPDMVDTADLPRGNDCLFEGSVRDYEVLDEANLIVTGSGNRRYHVALFQRAFGLRSSFSIGFTSSTGRICAGFSDVVYRGVTGPETARINSIRQLTEAQYEELQIRFGKKEPEAPEDVEPESVEGADVEELD